MKNGLILLLLVMLSSCVEPINKSYEQLPPGIWRGVLVLDQKSQLPATDEEVTFKTDHGGELPFNFEVKYDANENMTIHVMNGEEVVDVSDIVYNRDRATAKDTLRFDFTVFDTYITAIYEENIMEGHWHVPYRGTYSIPFKAYHGQSHRFSTDNETPVTDLSGSWDAVFEVGSEYEYPAVGEFKQEGNELRGTFMTETGDYRFLEGTIQGNKMFLSCFEGAHAFLFEGKVLDDGSITGIFRSGKHYTTAWTAKRNDNAKIGDAFQLTKVNDPDKPLNFTFKDLEGNNVSLSDKKYDNKIKLIKVSGTWCPNCKDEMEYLLDYFKTNPNNDVAVIEVNFERYKDEAKNIAQLRRYKEKMNIPFDVLYGGTSSKKVASEKFPQLSKIISYPTLLFVDRNNKIRKVYTGFTGPATSGFEKFDSDFKRILAQLINEN